MAITWEKLAFEDDVLLKAATSLGGMGFFLDEDDMASDSAVKVASQQSIKKYVDDNAGGGGYTEGARAYNSSNLAVPDRTWTTLTFDSERYDTDDIHSTASNTSRLTCKTAGKYLIIGQVRFTSGLGSWRGLHIKLNGETIISFDKRMFDGAASCQGVTVFSLSVDDYVELLAYHDSGSEESIYSEDNSSPEFMMQRIG